MLKFLKYEFKRNWKFNILLLFSFIILTITIKILYYTEDHKYTLAKSIAILCLLGASFSVFFYYIKNFSKDLYSDTGYFTFSLPISGYTYFWGKIIFYLTYSVILFPLSFISFSIISERDIMNIISSINFNDHNLILTAISSILFTIFFNVSVYLSITITHYISKSKNIYFLWIFILVFIMVSGSYLQLKINSLFDPISFINNTVLYTNISILLIYIIISGTLGGYLIDKKLELQ
ncbi:hypothetical protein [Streptobacillus notomytis]|uniref:hypothetical protein n=1 Tax=Streptobacillus notomytis TaxID=1712031 RepID=UPI00082A4A0D|nr:hypothetical protein [Streptobacillus notomytis]